MKKLITLVCIIISVGVQAQQINGKVCMEGDKSPAQFASVGLVQLPDSSILSGVITLTDGGYSFNDVKAGNYLIKVSFLGYEGIAKEVSVAEGVNITVDTIYLVEKATSVGEVTIVGERLKGKELVDRTTYSIPPMVAKTSTNGYELLKKIPQVNVDFQNNVTLNGSANFIIQVDGRQRDKEYLAKLLPSDIESIEIINNPSGKYEGNVDGVINIILKKEARYGVSGNVGFNVKPFNKVTYTANGSLDYSLGKITFYITAFTGSQNLHVGSKTDNYFKNLDSTMHASSKGKIKIDFSSVNAGFDYYMNDKNNLSLNINYKPTGQTINVNSETDLLKGEIPINTMLSKTEEKTQSDETTVSLFYKKSFRKPVKEFSMETSYYMFKSTDGNNFINTHYLYNDEDPLYSDSRVEENINKRNYLSTKLDYVHPLGMNTRLEAGYQFYYQEMGYDFNVDQSELSNLFEYNELRNSAYAGFIVNIKKIGLQATLRAENSHINADSVTSPDYTCLLPAANLQYKFSSTHNLKLTYNRRINRPGIYQMNPYLRLGTNYDISQGNPNLRPDYRDRLQLTYTWNFGNNYFSPNIYYEFLSDKVGTKYLSIESPFDGKTTTFSKPYNLLNGYEFGGGLNAMLWFVNINARLFKGHYDEYADKTYVIPARDYFSYSITSYAYTQLDKAKKTTAFAFLSYNGVSVDAQAKTYNLAFYGAGVQRQIKDHNIGFVWLLPFSEEVDLTRTETRTPVVDINNAISFDVSWYIQFMYSYKFNKGKNVKKIGHKVNVESDSKNSGLGL